MLSGTTFDAVTVSVDGAEYLVEMEADAGTLGYDHGQLRRRPRGGRGLVDPGESHLRGRRAHPGVGWDIRADGSRRSAGRGRPTPVDVESPSSSALLKRFADRYASAIDESGLADTLAAEEALSPTT